MESKTGFELGKAIQQWRDGLAQQPAVNADRQRELTTHLEDAVAELTGRGLSAEEAFWLARRRVGSPAELGAEFAKAAPEAVWMDRALWGAISLASIWAINWVLNLTKVPWIKWAAPEDAAKFSFVQNTAVWLVHVVAMLAFLTLLSRGALAGRWKKLKAGLDSQAARIVMPLGLAAAALDIAWFMVQAFRATKGVELPMGQFIPAHVVFWLALGQASIWWLTLLSFIQWVRRRQRGINPALAPR
jgi:hypothetical protein